MVSCLAFSSDFRSPVLINTGESACLIIVFPHFLLLFFFFLSLCCACVSFFFCFSLSLSLFSPFFAQFLWISKRAVCYKLSAHFTLYNIISTCISVFQAIFYICLYQHLAFRGQKILYYIYQRVKQRLRVLASPPLSILLALQGFLPVS